MAEVNLQKFGYQSSTAVTGNVTLDANDFGVVQNVTADATVTLPATAAKNNFILRVGADNVTLAISPAAADKIAGYTAASSGVGTDNKDLIFTDQPIGSFVQLQGDGVDGYTITALHGAPTFEA